VKTESRARFAAVWREAYVDVALVSGSVREWLSRHTYQRRLGETTVLKRVLFFAYGSVSYLIFFGTYLYAVGFVGNFGVPTTLDGPPSGSLVTALLVDVGLLTLFAVQHSVMARPWFKRLWTRFVPEPIERSTYVLFSSLALILLFWQWRSLGGMIWTVENQVGEIVLRGLFMFGFGLVLFSTFLINHFDLFGLRQIWLYLIGRPYTSLRFRTPGPYRLVRHPLYVGWLFAFWMTPTMSVAHLLFAVATTAYILLAIQFEERDLVNEFGESYEAYRRSVPMLIPSARRRASSEARAAKPGRAA
jgi:methanethiol S-methyltransferase